MKTLVLNNISAGFNDGSIYDFVRMASSPGDEITLRQVDANTDFDFALADFSRFDIVVAAGGDGTVASVCYRLRYSGTPVLVFPSGTANLIAQNICMPSETPALAKLVREGNTMDFDLGEFDFGDRKIGFMMMAGCGYDASIMASARDNKQRLGALAYFKAAFDNASPPVADIRLEVDGAVVETKGVGIVIMNFSKIQFDVSFGVNSSPIDGLLDVCVLATQSAWDLIPSAIGAAIDKSGRLLEQSDALQYYHGREVRISTAPELFVEYDGEASELTSPFVARVHPHAAKLLVSDACLEQYRS